jgi:hypothetical protein
MTIARFETDPSHVEQMLARRADLIAAVRARYVGPLHARLARLARLDTWHWESAATLQAALAGAPTLSEARAAFALTTNNTAEQGQLVDER